MSYHDKQCSKKLQSYNSLQPLLICQLNPSNKSPDFKSCGIGEVLQWVMGKDAMLVFKTEVIQAAGSLQVCAGQFVFIESAIPNMVNLLESNDFAANLQMRQTLLITWIEINFCKTLK